MAKVTMYQKGYVDEIIVDNFSKRNVKALEGVAGYGFDDSGECRIRMRFFDGLAVATDDSGLVMKYPKLCEVEQSEKMQRAIYEHTGRTEFGQFDVALTFGELTRYKLVADYTIWSLQGDNEDKDIWAIHTKDGKFLFDVLEEDYVKLLDAEKVDSGYLEPCVTEDEITRMQHDYGILWTEKFSEEIIECGKN